MIGKLKCVLLNCIIILLYSCEYNLDKENFRDIEKPANYHKIDLSILKESDTIKIFNPTVLTYNFNTYGLTISEGNFMIGDKSWKVYSNSGEISINPDYFATGIDTLKLFMYTNSGTGSIADYKGVEVYKVEKKWIIILDGRSEPELPLFNSITEDGFLLLKWNKCTQFNFKNYRIYGSYGNYSFSKEIKNINDTFYIDSCYIGGVSNFRIYANVLTNTYSGFGNGIQVNDSFPTLMYDNISVDSVRIFWKKSKYRSKYKFLSGGKIIGASFIDSTIVVSQPPFGSYTILQMYISPMHRNFSDVTTFSFQTEYSFGSHIFNNIQSYGYNITEHVIYSDMYDYLDCYSVSPFKKINHIKFDTYTFSQGKFSCPTNSGKVAVLTKNNIYVYANKNLINPIVIPYNKASNIEHFFITDNDFIAIASYKKYQIISINEGKVIFTDTLANYYPNPYYMNVSSCFATSINGKYFCYVSENGLTFYENSGSALVKKYSDSRKYNSVLFDEANSDNLLLKVENTNFIEVRNAADFTLIKTLNAFSGYMCNIDPCSGYLLLNGYDYLYIYDLKNEKVLLKIKNNDLIPYLYGNLILGFGAHVLNISKFLPQ